MGEGEADIERDVGCSSEEGEDEEIKGLHRMRLAGGVLGDKAGETHDNGTERSILDDLSANDGISEKSPEGGGDETGVDSGDDGERSRALCEESTGREELEGEGEEVECKEETEFDAT